MIDLNLFSLVYRLFYFYYFVVFGSISLRLWTIEGLLSLGFKFRD